MEGIIDKENERVRRFFVKRKLFLLFCKARPTPLQHVKIKCCPSLGKRMQK